MPPDFARGPDLSEPSPPVQPTLMELFLAFSRMSLAGFGGVLGWARRSIVDQHRWMTAEEFNETFALCHILPGPNIVNLSFVFGSRFGGVACGPSAFPGLIGAPPVVPTAPASVYSSVGDPPAVPPAA